MSGPGSGQINLFPDAPDPAPPDLARSRPDLAPVWLQRMSLVSLVLLCLLLGLVLTLLPWWTAIWDHNTMLQHSPRLWAVLRLGFVRGLISGCGLLDIWIGFSEAIHYRDDRG